MSIPTQKLKFQSVEKGLVKTAMSAAADKRKILKDEFLKIEEKKQQERKLLASEYQDVTLADEIVNKRRNKSIRRSSNPSTNTSSPSSSTSNTPKVSRRQSAIQNGKRSNNNLNTSFSNEDDSQDNPIHESSPETVPMEAEGVHSSIPPQYQKLLQLGLSQEQVIQEE